MWMIARHENFIYFGGVNVKQAILDVKISVVTLRSSMKNRAKAGLHKFSQQNVNQTLLITFWQTKPLMWTEVHINNLCYDFFPLSLYHKKPKFKAQPC